MSTTRRQFIQGMVLAGTAAAGLGLGGCDDSDESGRSSGGTGDDGAQAQGKGGKPASKRPNVLLILNDEERHWAMTEACVVPERLAAYQSLIPARMKLRSRGVRFSNYYTATAPCSPARSVCYTGHHAPDTQVVDNLNFDQQESLNENVPTVADILARAGYYCAYKGKVHLAHDLDTAAEMRAMYGFRDWEGPSKLGDTEGPKSGWTRDPDIAADAEDWLTNTATSLGKPWFLAVNFINPHDVMMVDIDSRGEVQQAQSDSWPIMPPPPAEPYYYWWNPSKPGNFPGIDGYTPDSQGPRPQALDEWASLLSAMFGNVPLEDVEPYLCDVEVYAGETHKTTAKKTIRVPMWQAYLNYYLNCMIDNDAAMTTVLDALSATSLQESTIVLFGADHGELAMSHGGYSRYFDEAMTADAEDADTSTATLMPLRQKGPFAYEENNNVPFVVASFSDNASSLSRRYVPTLDIDVPALASSVDLVPTLIAWAGKTSSWYTQQFGSVLSGLDMREALPGTSLTSVVKAPARFTSPQWSSNGAGRTAVLMTADTPTTVDADAAYVLAGGGNAAEVVSYEKRGMLRAFFDGSTKYVRYFSPLDYATVNSEGSASIGYEEARALGNGQDLQVFDHGEDSLERWNVAENADVPSMNQRLHDLMVAELADPTRTPNTVRTMLCETGYAGYEDACESSTATTAA